VDQAIAIKAIAIKAIAGHQAEIREPKSEKPFPLLRFETLQALRPNRPLAR